MKIIRIEIERIEGSLRKPAGNARQSWCERLGFLLTLTDETGESGVGEASPLKGYSPDSPARCEEGLRSLTTARFPEFDLGLLFPGQIGPALDLLGPNNPAAKFAVETALLDLAGKRLGRRPCELLLPDGERPAVPIAALVSAGTAEEAIAETTAAWDRGIRTIKVKAGAADRFDDELEMLMGLRKRFGPGLEIRVDVNGAWAVEEAVRKLERIAPVGPRFVEQPTPPYLLLKMANVGELPVALAADETLQLPGTAERLSLVPSCRVFVLKPMVLGGLIASLRIARIARAQKKDVVVSHLFDGPVALAAAIELVHALPHPPLACGLDRHAGLSIWPETAIAGLGENTIRFVEGAGLGVVEKGGVK